MKEYSGEFEIHVTGFGTAGGGLAGFAERHGLKYVEILLDRGLEQHQPMLTVPGHGTLTQVRELAERWQTTLRSEHLYVSRVKIEAAPGNEDVPQHDDQAADDPDERYFEHHVKLLLADDSLTTVLALTDLVSPHVARLSRNARRQREDGTSERFVTQRCHRVGQIRARERLRGLTEALVSAGYQILDVEEEYVVADSNLRLDRGWITEATTHGNRASYEDQQRHAPAGTPNYPSTYLPVSDDGVSQRSAFDPAMKHFQHAYRPGDPVFADPEVETRWRDTRRAAMSHILSVVTASRWAEHLVLRGSLTLRAWLGEAAREPGDLDFVVVPHHHSADSPFATTLLAEVVGMVTDDPGPGLSAEKVAAEDIWTYERAAGKRLVFPWHVDGLPAGSVQLDFVFNEELPVEPELIAMPDVAGPVLAASPALSLAWKILWLESDSYPQGKDLFDAVLLAEHGPVSIDLIRTVLEPELPTGAQTFTPESVLRWDVDWLNFQDEYPRVEGDRDSWLRRLAIALDR